MTAAILLLGAKETMKTTAKAATVQRQRRIDWLLAHKHLWVGFPDGDLGISPDRRRWLAVWREIVEGMKTTGEVSIKTNWHDVGVPGLIRDARRQRRQS